jgi:hypothetical protein
MKTPTETVQATGRRSDRARAAGRRLLALAAVALVAFIIGAGWQYMRAERIEDRLAATDRQLAFTSLEARLGAATLEAQRGSFAVAGQLASEFFDGLQNRIQSTPDAARRHFAGVLDRRDQVIAGLARSDENTARLLSDLFLQWRTGMGELMRLEAWPDPAGSSDSAAGPGG